jgi:hypothetical protein
MLHAVAALEYEVVLVGGQNGRRHRQLDHLLPTDEARCQTGSRPRRYEAPAAGRDLRRTGSSSSSENREPIPTPTNFYGPSIAISGTPPTGPTSMGCWVGPDGKKSSAVDAFNRLGNVTQTGVGVSLRGPSAVPFASGPSRFRYGPILIFRLALRSAGSAIYPTTAKNLESTDPVKVFGCIVH